MSKYGRQGDAAPHLRLAFGHGFSAILILPLFSIYLVVLSTRRSAVKVA